MNKPWSIAIVFLLIVSALAPIFAQGIPTPAPFDVVIIRDQDSLTVYIPGNRSVSLKDIQFEYVDTNGKPKAILLETYSSFLGLPFDRLPTPICFRLRQRDKPVGFPEDCLKNVPKNRLFLHLLNSADIFWFDPLTEQGVLLTILRNGQFIDVCSATQSRCSLVIPPPAPTPTLDPKNVTSTVIASGSTTTTDNTTPVLVPTSAATLPPPTPITSPMPVPPTATPSRLDPARFIRDYYAAINNRQYQETWAMLSANYKDKTNSGNYQGYKDFWNTITRVEVLTTQVSSTGSDYATIFVILRYYLGTQGVYQEHEVTFSLIGSGNSNGWLIDDAPYKRIK